MDQKDTKRDQIKQQAAACVVEEKELEETLSRWGLESASYLVTPGHEKAIPVLAEQRDVASKVIDEAMKGASWGECVGVGAKVMHLRECVPDAVRKLEARKHKQAERERVARERAAKVIAELPRFPASGVSQLSAERYRELLGRGLKRISEVREVVELVAKNAEARRKIVSVESARSEVERRVEEMSPVEFEVKAAELLAEQPGLQKLYGDTWTESTAFRLFVVERLWTETLASNQVVTDSNRSISSSEAAFVPT